MSDLPDWIEDKIEFRADRDLQQRPVVQVFIEEDERPFLTRAQVQSRLKGDFTRGTILERLKELCELEILKNDPQSSGDVYWLANDKSDWPIPPDVVVESKSDEMTVSEFFDMNSVNNMAFGIAVVLVGSFLILIGGIINAIDFSISVINGLNLIAVGLIAIFIGWIIFPYGVFQYFKTRA